MFESRHARMLQQKIGEPTQFGQIPGPDALRHMKHQSRISGENLSGSHNPQEFWGWIAALWGLAVLDEAERAQRVSEQSQQKIDVLQQRYNDVSERLAGAARILSGSTETPPPAPPVNSSSMPPSREGHRHEDYVWRVRSRRPGRERPYRD